MVSFQCDGCADTVKKPKLDSHRQRCHATFTCLDCSTTFQNNDYRNHTSCISEAEKYQGALYKGKKGKQAQNGYNQSQAVSAGPAASNDNTSGTSDPATGSSSPAPGASIHPSRQAVINTTGNLGESSRPSYGNYGRGGFAGRGNFGNGPGRYGGVQARQPATGQNSVELKNGMRSWGTNTPLEGTPQPPSPVVNGFEKSQGKAAKGLPTATAEAKATGNGETEDKKKRKKKGDKGGTGSKANSSKNAKSETAAPETGAQIAAPTIASKPQPSSAAIAKVPSDAATEKKDRKDKKRKRNDEPDAPVAETPATTTETASAGLPEKTLKRLRKNFSKLPSSSDSSSLSLSDLVDRLSKGKKETLEVGEVMKGLQVEQVDGKWVLKV